MKPPPGTIDEDDFVYFADGSRWAVEEEHDSDRKKGRARPADRAWDEKRPNDEKKWTTTFGEYRYVLEISGGRQGCPARQDIRTRAGVISLT